MDEMIDKKIKLVKCQCWNLGRKYTDAECKLCLCLKFFHNKILKEKSTHYQRHLATFIYHTLSEGDPLDKVGGDGNFLFFPSLVSVMASSH
jgi:hypothetical protein